METCGALVPPTNFIIQKLIQNVENTRESGMLQPKKWCVEMAHLPSKYEFAKTSVVIILIEMQRTCRGCMKHVRKIMRFVHNVKAK